MFRTTGAKKNRTPRFFSVVAALGCSLGIPTQCRSAELVLPGSTTAAGSSVVLSLSLSQSSAISAVQFDLDFEESAFSLVVTAGEALRKSSKNLFAADLAGGKKRFLIAGLNSNPVPDGTLINIFVNVRPTAPDGSHRIGISHLVGADRGGNYAEVTGTGAILAIQGAPDPSARMQIEGVVNAASFLPGPIAPGEIITLIGSAIGPDEPAKAPMTSTLLGGTRVVFDGVAAPLLFAGRDQINLVAPYEISGKTTTQLRVIKNGQEIVGVGVPVASSAPAMFAGVAGLGQGAILNQNTSLNSASNPADRDSIVVLFANGAGQTDPPGRNGEIAGEKAMKPLLPVRAWIGGFEAEVLYAGSSFDSINGLLQVNCRVPAAVASGFEVPVSLQAGSIRSQDGVTIAIR